MTETSERPCADGTIGLRLTNESDGYTIRLNDCVSLRISERPWPRNMKTAEIQKGLIITYGGKEMAEEGVGFGVPAAVYDEGTVFSKTSRIALVSAAPEKVVLRKIFVMDATSRRTLGSMRFNSGPFFKVMAVVRQLAEELYRANRPFRRFIWLVFKIEKAIGIEREFPRTNPMGEIGVTYEIGRDGVLAHVDLSMLSRKRLRKICLLNEQGATFFRRYFDAETELIDEEMGVWDEVPADWAGISDPEHGLSFVMRKVSGAILYRGSEHIAGFLSWTGLTYEMRPEQGFFSYGIKLCVGRRP